MGNNTSYIVLLITYLHNGINTPSLPSSKHYTPIGPHTPHTVPSLALSPHHTLPGTPELHQTHRLEKAGQSPLMTNRSLASCFSSFMLNSTMEEMVFIFRLQPPLLFHWELSLSIFMLRTFQILAPRFLLDIWPLTLKSWRRFDILIYVKNIRLETW